MNRFVIAVTFVNNNIMILWHAAFVYCVLIEFYSAGELFDRNRRGRVGRWSRSAGIRKVFVVSVVSQGREL